VLAAGSEAAAEKSLRRLYDLLIAPIAGLLPRKGEHLVLVPQGPLFLVPFAALKDPSGHYLNGALSDR
jgi:CHAT domain-containing protein